MEDFINQYFINPIWDKTGYNLVNTFFYAIVALIALYFLYKYLKKRVIFDEKFIAGVLTFVLFGSTLRVVTDSIDGQIFKPITPLHKFIIDTHIYDYGYFTVTPGIYILTAFLLIISIIVLLKLKKIELLPWIGGILFLFHFLLILPFMEYAIYALAVLFLAAIPTYAAYIYFKGDKILSGIVGGQSLDGAATFFVIDIFSKISGKEYFEQHVISSAIGVSSGSFFTFFVVKILVSFGAAYLLSKEKMDKQDRNFLALIFIIMGLAPGLRDMIRMMAGT